jgi:CRISPR/Cas system CSM-associated protein Csm2 small subunit
MMEEKMRLLTYLELTRCTKPQLWDLYFQVRDALRDLSEGSDDYKTAMLNIQHIRLFLARRDYTPC